MGSIHHEHLSLSDLIRLFSEKDSMRAQSTWYLGKECDKWEEMEQKWSAKEYISIGKNLLTSYFSP